MEANYRSGKIAANYLMELLKTVAVSLIITFLILLGAAIFLCFTDFPEKYTLPSAILGTIAGVFAGSTIAARKNPEKSLISSLLTALVYALLSFIIGSILQGKLVFTTNTALFFVIALVTGGVANILATRKKSSKKYSSSAKTDPLKKKRSAKSYSFSKSSR